VKLLALDTATVTGWAACDPGDPPVWGAQRMGPQGASLAICGSVYRRWLHAKIAELQPETVVFEAPYIPAPAVWLNQKPKAKPPPPMNADTIRKLCGFAWETEVTCATYGILCHEVTPMQSARHFTGRGSWGGREAKKAAVMAMCRRYGFDVQTDDEADALAVLMLAESVIYPTAALRRRQPLAGMINRL
jgi:hypothetical protein